MKNLNWTAFTKKANLWQDFLPFETPPSVNMNVINSQTQFVHPILFPLFSLVNSQMDFKLLVPGGLVWVFTLRGFVCWLQTTESSRSGWVTLAKCDKKQHKCTLELITVWISHPQTLTLTLMLIFKLESETDTIFSSVWIASRSFANCLGEVWNQVWSMNNWIREGCKDLTRHEKDLRNYLKSCGTCGGLCLCIIQKYDTDSAPRGE